jgi:hypothetical protein
MHVYYTQQPQSSTIYGRQDFKATQPARSELLGRFEPVPSLQNLTCRVRITRFVSSFLPRRFKPRNWLDSLVQASTSKAAVQGLDFVTVSPIARAKRQILWKITQPVSRCHTMHPADRIDSPKGHGQLAVSPESTKSTIFSIILRPVWN